MSDDEINFKVNEELKIHPELARLVLRKFLFKLMPKTNKLEHFSNWLSRMNHKHSEYNFTMNKKLLLWLKAVHDKVSRDPDILRVKNMLSGGGSKKNLNYNIDSLIGGIRYSLSYEQYDFSHIDNQHNLSVQTGGNNTEISKFIDGLTKELMKSGIIISKDDIHKLKDIGSQLVKKQLKITTLADYINKLKNILYISGKNKKYLRLNIGEVILNKDLIDQITREINDNRHCISSLVTQKAGKCEELLELIAGLKKQILIDDVPFGGLIDL